MSRLNRRNYYRILHVQPDAPAAVLKSSYRALMRSLEMHPDRGGEHWNAALINEAYAVLSDPVQRAEYDRSFDMSRLRGGPPPGRDAATSRSQPDSPRTPDEAVSQCLFCGSRRTLADSPPPDAVCLDCRSPLTPAGAPHLETFGRRAALRVAKEGTIRCFTAWPQRVPDEGRIVDLSPRGMQFERDTPLERYQIVKLEGSLVDAVARVANCRPRGDAFAVGVEFYTVCFHQARGTFVSTTA